MSPVFTSYLTSALLLAVGSAVSWAISKGIVPESDKNVLTNDIAGALVAAIGVFFVWFKGRMASPKGLVKSIGASDPTAMKNALQDATVPDQSAVLKAVNDAKNGLKVVPAASAPGIPAANIPIITGAAK